MKIQLNDSGPWQYVNGPWEFDDEHIFAPIGGVEEDDDRGLQGYRFAFCKSHGWVDFQVSFQLRYPRGHCDGGLVFRATDSQNFYMLHFPDCGQASRAQNFWVSLSRMTGEGVLKTIKTQYVNRVASQPYEVWHHATVDVFGNRLVVIIDERGIFEVELPDAHPTCGHLGMMSFRGAQIRDISVEGVPARMSNWNDDDQRQPHWFYPCPTYERVWQQPYALEFDSSGQLLLLYRQHNVVGKSLDSFDWFLVRSSDNGRTWTDPQSLTHLLPTFKDKEITPPGVCLHRFPNGSLKLLTLEKRTLRCIESTDAGQSWSISEVLSELGPVPLGLKSYAWGPQPLLNLCDGSILMMLYGSSDYQHKELTAHTWGALHCQAYTCRSTNGGKTWSSTLVSIDNCGNAPQTSVPVACNLDLTEICAVEVDAGKVMALIRPIYSPWMWESWSHDGGANWGPCMRGPFPGYATPNMLCTQSGALLVAHRLPGLTVHCSLDRGITWDQGMMIDSGLWAMGSMVEVQPDVVLYVYWDTNYSLMRGQFMKVTSTGLRCQKIW